MNISFG